jgi:hypothetical protein
MTNHFVFRAGVSLVSILMAVGSLARPAIVVNIGLLPITCRTTEWNRRRLIASCDSILRR